MKAEKDEVLRQNEIDANKLQVVALLVAAISFLVVYIFVQLGIFRVHRWHEDAVKIVMVITELFMISAVVLSIHYKYEKPWLKNIMLFDLILAFMTMDMFFTYATSILMVIPIILSSRYFSKKYTIGVSIIVIFAFFVSSILGALYGNYDINQLELTPGTIINMGKEIWIADVVEKGGIAYDPWLMVKHVLLNSFTARLLQTVIAAAISVTIAHQGNLMVLKQKRLTEKTARLGAELDFAAKIQSDMLPSSFPAFPERNDFEIYASMDPAKEIGGDFYDFFMIDDDHLFMSIADVSGKGVPAALFMMSAKIYLTEHIKMGKSPAEALTNVNKALCKNNENMMFVSVWAGILELSTGKLTAVNAGHEYPIIKSPDGSFDHYEDTHGLIAGVFEDNEYSNYELILQPGSKIFIYTDGVPEATDKEFNMFGTSRILDSLNALSDASPVAILIGIRKAVDEFVQDAEQFDDMTMLCLEYKGNNS